MTLIKSKVLLAAFFVFTSLLFSPLSFAETGSACKKDFEKLCPNVQMGAGRGMKCLQEHNSDLSSACQAEIEQMQERSESVKNDCDPDIQQLCPDALSEPGGRMECLKEHRSELSPVCERSLRGRKMTSSRSVKLNPER